MCSRPAPTVGWMALYPSTRQSPLTRFNRCAGLRLSSKPRVARAIPHPPSAPSPDGEGKACARSRHWLAPGRHRPAAIFLPPGEGGAQRRMRDAAVCSRPASTVGWMALYPSTRQSPLTRFNRSAGLRLSSKPRVARAIPHPPAAPSPDGEGKASRLRDTGWHHTAPAPHSCPSPSGRRWRAAPDEGGHGCAVGRPRP